MRTLTFQSSWRCEKLWGFPHLPSICLWLDLLLKPQSIKSLRNLSIRNLLIPTALFLTVHTLEAKLILIYNIKSTENLAIYHPQTQASAITVLSTNRLTSIYSSCLSLLAVITMSLRQYFSKSLVNSKNKHSSCDFIETSLLKLLAKVDTFRTVNG